MQTPYAREALPAFNPKLTRRAGKPKLVVLTTPALRGRMVYQEVQTNGNRITIVSTTKTTVDLSRRKQKFTKGNFANQHHDPTCRIMIRKDEVKELNQVIERW